MLNTFFTSEIKDFIYLLLFIYFYQFPQSHVCNKDIQLTMQLLLIWKKERAT